MGPDLNPIEGKESGCLKRLSNKMSYIFSGCIKLFNSLIQYKPKPNLQNLAHKHNHAQVSQSGVRSINRKGHSRV